jgi:Carboxypeptidase regulatory-like domain
MSSKFRSVILIVLGLALSASSASAQNVYASVTGTVTDPQANAMPGVKVTATNTGTALVRTAVTDAHGDYLLNILPVGTYNISASIQGFKEAVVNGIVLQVDQQARQNFTLQVGALTQTITVEGGAAVLQTESSSISQVVNNQEVVELPMNGRNLNQLALIVAGVSPANQTNVEAGSASTVQTFSVAGSRSNTNAFMIDGVANTDDAIDNSALHPSLEMVQEFRVETSTYSAEFGHYSGGQVNITTKGGTNQLHGSLFEFLRNQIFDAKNAFVLPTQAKPPLQRNQFGGSVGGPILKKKLFFFADYEGLRYIDGETGTGTVPTAAMLGGDFSILLQANNPYTHTVTQLLDPNTHAPIPGNIITAINPVGAKIAALYPTGTAALNNYTVNPKLVQSDDEYNGRVDYLLSSNDTISGRLTYLRENVNQPYPLGAAVSPLVGYGSIQPSSQYNTFAGDTHIFSPTMINDFKLGFSRIVLSVANQNSANVAGALGITGLDPAAYASYSGTPTFSVSGFATIGAVNFFPQIRADNTYQISDSISWTKGRHALKFGVDLQQFQLYQDVNTNVRGTFTFSGQYSGFGLADLLLGDPSQTTKLQLPGPLWSYAINSSRSFYAVDNWTISPRLTFNFGLRYELDPPVYYKGGQQAGFNPLLGVIQVPQQTNSFISPFNNTPPIPIPVPIQQVNTKTICDENRTNLAPRVGAAYRPFHDSKTVIHAGYGIFYDEPFTNTSCGSSSMLWQYSESFVGALKGSAPNISLSNPFPTALLGSAFTPTANYPSKHVTPYVNEYNLDIQREITPTMVFEVGYLGSEGVHLPLSLNINQDMPGAGTVASRRPFAALGLLNTITWNSYTAVSNYNAMIVRLEKRTSHGATFLVNYTWSHSTDDSTGAVQNFYNIAGERGNSTFDIRQRFVASYVYQLPFGKGRWKGSNWNGVEQFVLGGWQTNGIFTDQTGFALTATISGLDNSQTGGLADRPNESGSTVAASPTIAQWFNTAAFSMPAPGQFGNENRGSIVGPGLVDFDVSLSKNFKFGERHDFQFRAEFFNVFNHPNFLNPSTTFNSPSFGVISGALAGREVQFGLRYGF